jgi:hypothetical protein
MLATAMPDDPRIKRVLKRYRKGEQFPDASVELTNLGVDELLQACRCDEANSLNLPKELDDYAIVYLSRRMGIEFDSACFDFYLHSYVRSEFVSTYFADPSITSRPAPEDGPPPGVPLPEGMRWFAVRPKDGKEHYEAFEIKDSEGEN